MTSASAIKESLSTMTLRTQLEIVAKVCLELGLLLTTRSSNTSMTRCCSSFETQFLW